MLAADRIDVVISESFLAKQLIKQNPILRDINEVLIFANTPIYSYIHKKHLELSGRITSSLKEMEKDGTFEAISVAAEAKFLRLTGGPMNVGACGWMTAFSR